MRKNPTPATIKALFAQSGNGCAFPDCSHTLIDDRHLFVGELCHINAVAKKDARFDSSLSDDNLRSYENLILLCHAHHKRVDSFEEEYTVEILKEMRIQHERQQQAKSFAPPDTAVVDASIQLIHEDWTLNLEQVVDQLQTVLDTGVGMHLTGTNMATVEYARVMFAYQDLLQRLEVTERAKLHEEQSRWREKLLDEAAAVSEEGTIAFDIRNSILIEGARERLRELKEHLIHL